MDIRVELWAEGYLRPKYHATVMVDHVLRRFGEFSVFSYDRLWKWCAARALPVWSGGAREGSYIFHISRREMDDMHRSLVQHWIKANPCKTEKHHFRRGHGPNDDLWICRVCGMKIDQVQAFDLAQYERYDPALVDVQIR